MQEDANLLQSMKSGDPMACTVLFETYADRLYRLALGILDQPQEAEDVVQETCLKALTHSPEFAGRSSIGTWLYRIAYNTSLEHLRRKEASPLPPEDGSLEEENPSIPMPGNFVEWQTPEALAIGSEDRAVLAGQIQSLPEKLRTVFVLRDIEEVSTAEAAEILGITESLVKVRLHRARLSLREHLAEHFTRRLVRHGEN
jgi:RNA polymerase sigma-70 factor (ECF subfamily)